MAHVLILARDKSLPVKMGGLLSLASDGILGKGLFGGDDSGLCTGDGIGISGGVMDLELAVLTVLIGCD
jgi:hypothetical protein